MKKIISFANQKGGVGKTTTTKNIGVALQKKSKKVLLVDFDPQGNLSSYLGYEFDDKPTISELMISVINNHPIDFTQAIHHSEINNVTGHNRTSACKLIGMTSVPSIIKSIYDEAKLIVINSNLNQRQELLPSEKAFAYKMQLEALKHQGKTTSCQVGTKFNETQRNIVLNCIENQKDSIGIDLYKQIINLLNNH